MSRAIDLLPLARANGHGRQVRGLTRFVALTQPIDGGKRRMRGAALTVEVEGRDLDYDERARLLDFAAAHVREAAT
jgi:hypothetical protein